MGLIDRLDRRGFLGLAAVALAASTQARAQTLIAGTPEFDSGYLRNSIAEAQARADEEARAQATPADQQEAERWWQAPVASQQDWRRALLSGERSITMRRDGALRRVRYCTQDGLLDREGYAQACMLLRDVQAGKLAAMDPGLLDLLCGMQRWAQHNGREANFEILSGFRSLQTNSATEGAALNSLHLYAKAADIRVEGISSSMLGAMAKQFNVAGGNGIYVNRGFVHVDTGRSRTWISTESRKRG
ncbi:YcbK family protein [Paucibacter soli]|uniref:YcbK family protein n=1 Tax=Paucibacter soli TaxID=3133433 RepID=UPI0030B2BC8C